MTNKDQNIKQNKSDFRLIANAVLLYHQQQNNLFADQVVSEKIQLPAEEIRNTVENWFDQPLEKILHCLDPERIKLQIKKTKEFLKLTADNIPSIQIIPMSESETGSYEKKIIIRYQFSETPLGEVTIASTGKGICYLAFVDENKTTAYEKLKERFAFGLFLNEEDNLQKTALSAFNFNNNSPAICLHLKATPFQIETWNKLLKIPSGGLLSYSELASDKKYSHATGNAVGSNPVAYLIPCHRMVPATGEFGEYHWGKARKAALICMEALNQPIIN